MRTDGESALADVHAELGVEERSLIARVARRGGSPAHEAWLLAPVFGPLVLFERTLGAPGDVVLGMDALAQLSGLAILVYGVVSKAHPLGEDSVSVHLTAIPLLLGGRSGLGVVGRVRSSLRVVATDDTRRRPRSAISRLAIGSTPRADRPTRER